MKNVLIKSHILNRKKSDGYSLLVNRLGTINIYLDSSTNNDILTDCYYRYYDFWNRESVNELRSVPTEGFIYEGIKFNMISCPSGELDDKLFNAYSFADGENVLHEGYMLGETEVTSQLFDAVMADNDIQNKEHDSYIKTPITCMSWYDCIEFCNRLSDYFGLNRYYNIRDKKKDMEENKYIVKAKVDIPNPNANGFRLPTLLEWGLAARAGTDVNVKLRGYTSDIGFLEYRAMWSRRSMSDKKPKEKQPVAQKIPNDWGFYDMWGNVDEWCWDPRQGDGGIEENGYTGGSVSSDADKYNKVYYTTNDGVNKIGTIVLGRYCLGFRIAKNMH